MSSSTVTTIRRVGSTSTRAASIVHRLATQHSLDQVWIHLSNRKYRYQVRTFLGNHKPYIIRGISSLVTSKWVAVGSMSVARRTHTATLLNSGKVLVAGGRDETVAHASCELYDPDTETWSITGSMASPRSRHTAVRLTINDTDVVFVFGGSRTINFDPVVVIEYYNGTSGVWRTIVDPMRQGRFSHTTTLLLDGRLLSTGGQGNTSKLASTEIFDPVTLTSQMVGSLNFARYQHTATIMSTTGDVLVTGGVGVGNVFLSSCELFNINSRNWSWAANMSYSRSLGTMIPLMPASSSLLITGGQAINISVSSNQLYNPLTKTLSTSSSLNLGRYAHTSTLMYYQSTALVLVTGGVDPLLQITESTELYVIANSTWLNIANMTSRRGLHSATLLSGSSPSILLTGGLWNRSGINLRTAERIIFT